MASSAGRAALPIIVVGGLIAAGAGVLAVMDRSTRSRRDGSPAAPGTPQVSARLPVSLWPAGGVEPSVARGSRGWAEMLAALYHSETSVDAAARARAVVLAEFGRREQDERREVALEAHVLAGRYEPDLVAAAWLHPLRAIRRADLAAFGLAATALSALDAAAELDEQPELAARWRRELGIDNVRPEITPGIIADTPADRRGMLWALTLDLAGQRILSR